MRRKWLLTKTVGPKRKVSRVQVIDPSVDPKYLAWLREQRCAASHWPGATSCQGVVEAHHHTGGRGKSQRSDDRMAFPLCAQHHRPEFHDGHGMFEGWGKIQRREWQDAMSAAYRVNYERRIAA